MDRKKKVILCVIVVLLLFTACLFLFGQYQPDGLEDRTLQTAQRTAAAGWGHAQTAAVLYENEEGFVLEDGLELEGTFDPGVAGTYEIWINYVTETKTYLEYDFRLELSGTSYAASVPAIWYEDATERPLDRYGDEMNVQAGLAACAVNNALIDTADVAGSHLTVELAAGEQSYCIRVNQPVRVYGVYLVSTEKKANGLELTASPEQTGTQLLMLEAENYTLKSDSYIRGKNVKNAALSPYNTYQEKINVIDANSWNTVGQKVLWVVNVERAGWYRLGFRYSQYSEANKFSYRNLFVDGISVGEPVAFGSTALNSYANLTVEQDGQDLWVWIEAGEHTISMEVTMEPVVEAYNELLAIMQDVSAIAMDLQKLTAGNTDENRTWDMEQYLPEVPGELEECRVRIQAVYQMLWDLEGVEPSYANRLLQATQVLENILADYRLIPNEAENLNEGDGSVNSCLGEVLQMLVQQPLSLDRVYLYQDAQLPDASCNIFVTILEEGKRLAETYMPGANGADYTADGTDTGELEVWVNMSTSYAEILQQMIDETYNLEHGTNITICIMNNEQKLILSNATDSNPDVVLGVNFYTPYELAIRGAAKNLLEYEDFAEFYSSQYNVAGLTPLAYDGGIYGAVDSLNYQVLFYRKDILENLGLEVPQTWEDVKNMMPTLLRYSMNFYTTLASGSSFKTFNMTGPFLYENGGSFYSDDGASVAFNTSDAQVGMTQMTELFTVYSLSEYTANFFNSFRYGETPVGVGNFSTYIQLTTAAPELEGQWGIALIPGQLNADGSVERYQAADSTASMIFDNTDMPEESWEFLKWWLSAEIQAEFSNRLESTYGPAYRWNTANLVAFESLPYSEEDKAVILEQILYQKETARHPAGYMVEREVSNIWNEVVVNGKGLTESIDRAVIACNREIIRKLQEFGYMDEDGNLIQPYTTQDVKAWMGLTEGGDADE